jgi:branched-chain amino acid transport system ATP-binding protein
VTLPNGSGPSDLAGPVARLPDLAELDALAKGPPMVAIDALVAGYGTTQILHEVSLRVGAGQSLCLIGPNGAGKSTVLHSIFGFARVLSGRIVVGGNDVTRLPPSEKLRTAGIAYILQENSVFPDMTVEDNLLMGGFLLPHPQQAVEAAERMFSKYPRLAQRRSEHASALSGGERRLLEIARALVMDPAVLLVDEPSIGLEPRYIEMVFDMLGELQRRDGKTIVLVEQNAKKGLEFSDIAYVLISGRVEMAGVGAELARNPDVSRLFLGGP